MEDNATGFLVRSTASNWSKGSVLAVDAGSHLAAITRILENDFPKAVPTQDTRYVPASGELVHSPEGTGSQRSSPDTDRSPGQCSRESTPPLTLTTLHSGPFAGLPFPFSTASANAAYLVREHVSTYLITHPHLDHLSGFAINTAAFHNTSRPKRLAALPFTVNAIKAHIFNDLIWPNLTDEDGGVGFVTFQRLTEGGNIALGEGHGRGFIEVCDGLSVRAFKVSHGKATMGHVPPPSGYRRGSNANVPEAVTAGHGHGHGHSHSHSQSVPYNGINAGGTHANMTTPKDMGRRGSLYSQASQPGTPTWPPEHGHPVVDSSAFFIRAETTVALSSSTPNFGASSGSHHSHTTTTHQPRSTEVLIFGDVEPDAVSLSPRTMLVWAEAAPKIAAGILKGIFIECSYTDSQADAVLFGHLAPRHVVAELVALAEVVEKERRELQHHREEREKERAARKRKRISGAVDRDPENGTSALDPGKHEERSGRRRLSRTPNPPTLSNTASSADEQMTDASSGPKTESFQLTTGLTSNTTSPTSQRRSSVNIASVASSGASHDGPLKGVKVVIIHVKDSLTDGPPIGDIILKELRTHETRLLEQGKALGCEFEVAQSGGSYWF